MSLKGILKESDSMRRKWDYLAKGTSSPEVEQIGEVVLSVQSAFSETWELGHQLGHRLSQVDDMVRVNNQAAITNAHAIKSHQDKYNEKMLKELGIVNEQNKILMNYLNELEEKVAKLTKEGVAK